MRAGKMGIAQRSEVRDRTPWSSWLLLVPVVTLLPWLLNTFHYSLPAPAEPYTADGCPYPSEQLIYRHIQALEDIGYRTIGTEEAALGEAYVEEQVRKLEQQCTAAGVVKCEVWVQRGDGKHSFDIMGHSILKLYKGIVNVILRISPLDADLVDAAPNALLLNSHVDSTLPSPGAADDGMGVGVMLEIARVLVERKDAISAPIIFLWNSAEETLQDASHLYSTQHETAKTVKAVINLEAAGTTGGALVFQATSKEVIDAYAHAPRPHGTVVAADIFASGIILSDTDFVQFEKYLNVTGLDMATVGHSYFYHTRKDRLEFIERGAGQHFAINVLAVCDYLLAPGSPLISAADLSPPDVVYFSLYDRVFIKYSMEMADQIYLALATAVATLLLTRYQWSRWRALVVALAGAPLGLVGGLLSANSVAALMSLVLGRGQSWFSHEDLCLVLFVPPAFAAHFAVQEALSSFLSIPDQASLEHAHFFAQPIWFAVLMLILQSLRIRSAYLFACTTAIALTVCVINETSQVLRGRKGRVGFKAGYVLGFAGFVFFAVEAVTNCLDIFVPLTGRMGTDAPTEFIVATISAFLGLQLFPPATSLLYRTSSRSQRRKIIIGVAAFSAAAIAFFANPSWSPYDAMHPRRVGVQYTYNVTTTDTTCHVAFMDRGPGAHGIASAIQERYGAAHDTLEANPLAQRGSDWDSLYPLSPFLEAHKFPLAKTSPWVASDLDFKWPEITVDVKEAVGTAGTRKLELTFIHTDLLWPVLAFHADVVDWSYDFAPPSGRRIHHIKSATSPDDQTLELSLTVKVDHPDDKISMHWTGIDTNQMYPGTALRKGLGQPASKYFVDMNAWLEEKYKGSMDVLMIGVVAGVLEI